jgi:hypothetical protein
MMKKYVLTNEAGDTGTGVKVKVGKFVHDAAQHAALLARLTSCAENPGLAVLVSPILPERSKLFQVHSWNVAVGDPGQAQNYTVIKEMPVVPQATLEMRLTFALLVLKELITNREFRVWAENWIADKDRSAEAATQVRKILEGEQEASAELEELAAWGASSTDDLKTVHKLDEQDQRALQAVQAAELAANRGGDQEAVSKAIANTFLEISKVASKVDLLTLATRVLGANQAQESEPDAGLAAN